MLRDEDRVASHRSLTPIVDRFCRRQSLLHELPRMLKDLVERVRLQIFLFPVSERESCAERTLLQCVEQFVEVTHRPGYPSLKTSRAKAATLPAGGATFNHQSL